MIRKMEETRFKIESIQIAGYCEIVFQLVKRYKEIPIAKLLFFSYILRNDKFSYTATYKGNNKKKLVNKFVSLISGDFEDYLSNIGYILKSIHLLNKNGNIKVENSSVLYAGKDYETSTILEISTFFDKAINESLEISDRQFMMEVVSSV